MATPFRFEQREVNGEIERVDHFRDGSVLVTKFKPTVGDVAVTALGCENPYTDNGPWRIGDERAKVLALFRRAAQGQATAGDWLRAQQVQLWYAPSAGGALRISPACVDWSTSGCKHDYITFKPIPEELKRGYLKLAMKDDSAVLPGVCDDCGLAMVRVRSPVSSTGWWWCDADGDVVRPATDGTLYPLQKKVRR